MMVKNMSKIKRQICFVKAIILLTIFVSCGCMMYTHKMYYGPELPREQIAVLLHGEGYIKITSIDGQPRNISSGLFGEPSKIQLLPGPHKVSVAYEAKYRFETTTTYRSKEDIIISFDAKAGDTYRLKSERKNVEIFGDIGTWDAWIEDITGYVN